jgi:hypothetical protein
LSAPESSRTRLVAAAAALAALAAGPAGCLRTTSFQCASDGNCSGSPAGRCEANGFCSFPDTSCTSGFRFGEHSGPDSGKCVGEGGSDGGIPPIDGVIDAAGCQATYSALPGGSAHVYRVLTGTANWSAQRTTCAGEGAYLVEPDDATELAALNMLAGAIEIWIGISDQTTEGTFVTTRDAAITFLPWTAGQPDDAPQGADCVFSSDTGMYSDDRCNIARRTICECDP